MIDRIVDPRERLMAQLMSIGGLMETVSNRQVFRRFELSNAQYEVLQILAAQSGPMSLSEISRMLVVSNANVTGLIDRMEAQNLVRRKTNPDDGRVRLIEVTATGRSRYKQAHTVLSAAVGEFLQGFKDAEIANFVKALDVLHMRAQAAATGLYKLRSNPGETPQRKSAAAK